MKIAILIQARSKSTRLPGKIYKIINGKSILQRVWESCKAAASALESVDEHQVNVVVIGPHNDAELQLHCAAHNYEFIAGMESDLLDRMSHASEVLNPDYIVRITSDCVTIPADVISQCVFEALREPPCDYISNTMIRTFIEGWDVQCCSRKGFEWFFKNQHEKREHPFVLFDENAKVRDAFTYDGLTIRHFLNAANPALIKTSIDTEEDFERISKQICKIENAQNNDTSK